MKPGTRDLLQATDCLIYETHLGRLPLSNIPMRLLHINLLCEATIKKGIRDIKLMERPCLVKRNEEEDTNGAEVCHRREGLSVVEVVGLRESQATRRTLWRVMEPSGLYLREYTHLHETTLTSDGQGTNVQVSC